MIYRPSDCGCGSHEYPPRSRPRCCCIPFCCPPWHRPDYPQPPMTPPTQPVSPLDVLSTANTTPQSVAAGGTLPFTTNLVSYGNAISHTPASPSIVITVPGLYRITFDSNFSPLTTAELPDITELELNLNGSPVPGAVVTETFTAATDVSNGGFNTIIEVPMAPATLTVTAPNGAVVEEATLTVERLSSLPNPLIPTPYPNYPM